VLLSFTVYVVALASSTVPATKFYHSYSNIGKQHCVLISFTVYVVALASSTVPSPSTVSAYSDLVC